jgi:tetratricopeptide (TPR) repeat protein
MRRWGLAVVVLMGVACASAPIRKADQAELDRADAAVLEGCYDCLIEARTIYARLAVGRARPLLVGRLFETELLIALREKELAMDAGESLARARALVGELAAGADGARVLALADAVPADAYGTPRRALQQFRRTRSAFLKGLPQELAWLETTPLAVPVRQYLALSLDCAYRAGPRQARVRQAVISATFETPRMQVPADAPPLLNYRNATCVTLDTPALEAILAAVPRFVEANYPLGRNAVALVQQRGDTVKTRAIVQAAYARFPQSPSVTYLNGAFNQMIGDCKVALGFYDETLALQPVHEDGLLGRTMCLTFLTRTDEAIAAATHMVTLGTDNVIEAFYWRSWNHHFRQELPPARRDIDRAKTMGSNPRIHTLAGVIEHDQDDLDISEEDLRIARGMSGGNRNCTAAWYLGLVLMKREQWTPSAVWFEQAMACYDQNVRESLDGLQKMRANPDLDEEFRAAQIAGFEAALVEDRRQYHAAAFNAANHYARGGAPEKAKPLIDIAARDPALAPRVADLRRAIGGSF